MNVKMRIAVEKRIASKLVDALVAAGYELSVTLDATDSTRKSDHEIWRSRDAAAIKKALMAGDEDWIKVFKPEQPARELPDGWVRLVYGNDGWDVVSDYTTNLEAIMAPISKFSEALSENPFAGMKEEAITET